MEDIAVIVIGEVTKETEAVTMMSTEVPFTIASTTMGEALVPATTTTEAPIVKAAIATTTTSITTEDYDFDSSSHSNSYRIYIRRGDSSG